VSASVDAGLVEQRILEHAQRGGLVTGWAALRLYGGHYFDGRAATCLLPVPLAEHGSRLRPAPGVTISRERVPASEAFTVLGIGCVSPERALLDEVRRLSASGDLRAAVVAVDMTAAARITSIRRMRRHLSSRPGARGIRWAARVLDLAEEHSVSPQESRLRLVWQLDAGWDRPLCNRDVLGPDGFIGRPDLLDPVRGIVAEYDGAVHRSRSRHARDVKREADFRAVGLECVTIVGADLRDPHRVVARLREAERRAGRHPRHWRLGPEPFALDDLLDLRDRHVE